MSHGTTAYKGNTPNRIRVGGIAPTASLANSLRIRNRATQTGPLSDASHRTLTEPHIVPLNGFSQTGPSVPLQGTHVHTPASTTGYRSLTPLPVWGVCTLTLSAPSGLSTLTELHRSQSHRAHRGPQHICPLPL